MAEPLDGEKASGEAPATPAGAPGEPQTQPESKSELPAVGSPPLSPAADIPAVEIVDVSTVEPDPAPAVAPEVVVAPAVAAVAEAEPDPITAGAPIAPAAPAGFRLRPRHKRYALFAASATIAAGIGVVIGAIAGAGFWAAPRADIAGLEARKAMEQSIAEERKTMQHSIAQLGKQVAGLKTELAKANKAANSKIAKIADRVETIATPTPAPARPPDITGSIPHQSQIAEVPIPRPAPRIAAVSTRPVVVPNWTIRAARGGYVYVEGYGDIYQVVPGAPLPGLGPVQSVKRENGRWMVVTPRGIIVAARDRRFFE